MSLVRPSLSNSSPAIHIRHAGKYGPQSQQPESPFRMVLVGRHEIDDMNVIKAFSRHACKVQHVIIAQRPKTQSDRERIVTSLLAVAQQSQSQAIMFVNMYPSCKTLSALRGVYTRIGLYLGKQFVLESNDETGLLEAISLLDVVAIHY